MDRRIWRLRDEVATALTGLLQELPRTSDPVDEEAAEELDAVAAGRAG